MNWKPKRFWTRAEAVEEAGAWAVRLDGRAVRTPAKAPLILPTRAMAEAMAAEWDAQSGEVRPETMPVTRAANSAIDKVGPQRAAVVGMIADYGGTDLLCYRAETPEALALRQAEVWDPLLDWAAGRLGAPLQVTRGVIPVAQPEDSRARLAAAVAAFDDFGLAGLHDLVGITGSLVIGLAIAHGRLTPEEGWAASRIDETWQAELWGKDDEAEAAEAVRRDGLLAAARFLGLAVG